MLTTSNAYINRVNIIKYPTQNLESGIKKYEQLNYFKPYKFI
jgi:hypothetical protein